LEELIRLLAEEGRAARAEARRERRRARVMIGVLALLLLVMGWSALSTRTLAQAEILAHGQPPAIGAGERAARRAELLAMLPGEKRRELERFEQEVDWLRGYMGTWDDDEAGAVVAMMLFRMAQSMDTMPSMEQQMRTMSGQMGALPAIVAELNQINAKLHVITGTMDSTMGRAGRMMPWMPFSP
jgi:hypothetical protein